jgi:hypothetical protein
MFCFNKAVWYLMESDFEMATPRNGRIVGFTIVLEMRANF